MNKIQPSISSQKLLAENCLSSLVRRFSGAQKKSKIIHEKYWHKNYRTIAVLVFIIINNIYIGCNRSPQTFSNQSDTTPSNTSSQTETKSKNTSAPKSPSIIYDSIIEQKRTEINQGKDPFFGVHFDFLWGTHKGTDDYPTTAEDLTVLISLLEELNVGSVRMPIRWRATFKDDGSPRNNIIKQYEEIIDIIPRDIDITVYLDSPSDYFRKMYIKNPDKFRDSYVSYVGNIVKRFGHRVKNWEIWNEQNNSFFYLQSANSLGWTPDNFVRDILVPASTTIRKIDPSAKIILGGFSFNGTIGHNTKKMVAPKTGYFLIPDFLEGIYTALNNAESSEDTQKVFDVCATHPSWYSSLWEGLWSPIEQTYGKNGTSDVMKKNGDNETPIWWTECNEPVSRSNATHQAQSLYNFFSEALKYRNRPKNPLEKVHWFTLRDRRFDRERSKGLLTAKSQRTQAFFAYKKLVLEQNRYVSLIDDFSYHNLYSEPINPAIWKFFCNSADNQCEKQQKITAEQYIFYAGNDKNSYTGIYTYRPVPLSENQNMNVSFKFSIGETQSDRNNTILQFGLGPINTNANNSVSFDELKNSQKYLVNFERDQMGHINISILARAPDNSLQSVSKQSCPLSNIDLMQTVEFNFDKGGKWEFKLANAKGDVCINANNKNESKHVSLGKIDNIGIFFSTFGKQGKKGFITLDDFYLSNKKLPQAENIHLAPRNR